MVTAMLARCLHRQSKVPDPTVLTSQPSLSSAFLKAESEHSGKSLTDSESVSMARAPIVLARMAVDTMKNHMVEASMTSVRSGEELEQTLLLGKI